MIKVLIAEDEYLVRVGLHTCIDWGAHGYVLLNDAVDGQDAYQKIVTLRPDIILLDLNMPKLTGLELLKRLSEEHIPVNVVVVSCYDDFENVRAAFRYGVVDYINKLSMSPAEMLDVLSRIKPLAAAVPSSVCAAQEDASQAPEELLKHAASSGAKLENPLPESLTDRRILIVSITQISGAKSSPLLIKENVARQIIKNSGIEPILCSDSEDNLCVALPEDVNVQAIAATLRQHLGPTLNCKTAIGIGPAFHDAEGLAKSIELAGQIRNEAFWGRTSEIRVYTEALQCAKEHIDAFSAYKKRLSAQVHAMNLVGILGVVDEYSAYYATLPDFPGDTFRKISLSLIELFNARDGSVQTDAFFHFQKVIMNARSAEAISEAITQLVHQSYINSPLAGSASFSPIVARAIEYIVGNPTKMYQLSEMAQLVNVSESYLGQLFKKETGMNFITYEHRYKVNIAKQLLDESMLVYEVCEKVGFDSGNYFAKIFKRFTGLSPTEYRSKTK